MIYSVVRIMTDKDKARLEELKSRKYSFDGEDVIDYYRLSCEELDGENENLKTENSKLKKVIEILKNLINLSLCIDEYEPNGDIVPLLCTKNNDYILNDDEFELLKEVLENV